MAAPSTIQNGTIQHWVVGRTAPSGQFTAQVVGVPELSATAATRAEALEQIRAMLSDWIASGQLIPVEVPPVNPLLHFKGHGDPNDPLEQEFVAELARLRRQDYEQAIREADEKCSSSSSTPIT
ncbi:MAG TPA: hypothetical protein VE988_09115 [Gemmataceae bacterium]|nr:hypothetical protein [Gemmataceae bacterium]